jgi:radical SAM protein with 4Fe4S-binding SPASM domain
VPDLISLVRRGAFAMRYGLRMQRGRRAVLAHLSRPDAVPVPFPTFVQLRVTNLCNLRCRMCGQWGDTGVFRERKGDLASDGEAERARVREMIGLRRQMGLDDYARLLAEIAPHKPIVSLFGGEPLLYPDVVPLVRHVKRCGLTLTMITNGSLLERHARELVEAGIDSIAVSIDGPPERHDTTRGREGSFRQAAAGVRAIARWRKELGRALPVQLAIFPITELNLDVVPEAMEALRALPLDAVNVGLRWFVPPAVGAAYEKVMREDLGVDGGSWKGFDFTWPAGADRAAALERVVPVLQAFRRRRLIDVHRGQPWTSFIPDVAPSDVPAWFKEPSRTFGHDLCPVAWYFAQVEPDGDVSFCGDFPDYVLGNVRRESFTSVWLGEKARAFRDRLSRGPLPICARCCGSYVYGRWPRPGGQATPA